MTGTRACYMSGTRIRVARGEALVDTLTAGEMVVVLRDGYETLEPVKWMGVSNIDVTRHPHVEEVAPIRIRRSAIADNVPARDVFLSPEHCLIIDGLCVPAKLLVNGGSIVSERHHAHVTYYHIELEQHGILLAENMPAESYLDTGNRSVFDNADGSRPLQPVFYINNESARWETDACAPLAKVPGEVATLWARLAKRSEQIGYPIPLAVLVGDPDIHILADGKIIRPVSDEASRHVFLVPGGVADVLLMSRFDIPSDRMIASQRDTRRLGARVNWISIRSQDDDAIIAADHPSLQVGWHDAEYDPTSIWRWTAGSAVIPWQNVSGHAVLTISCSPAGHDAAAPDAEIRRVA
jgi:hypothetical protein